MNFEVLTLFPHSLEPIFGASILGRASAKGVISVNCTDIRDYTKDKHRKVDDAPYGGGYGMVCTDKEGEPIALEFLAKRAGITIPKNEYEQKNQINSNSN